MAERNVILDGPVKFRLKKKVSNEHSDYLSRPIIVEWHCINMHHFVLQWKSRWCILKKLSPVAGRCLFVVALHSIVCCCDSCLWYHVFFVVLRALT